MGNLDTGNLFFPASWLFFLALSPSPDGAGNGFKDGVLIMRYLSRDQ